MIDSYNVVDVCVYMCVFILFLFHFFKYPFLLIHYSSFSEIGDRYEGEWEDDKKKGHGTYTYVDGDKYVGLWENDKKNGQGVFTFASGQVCDFHYILTLTQNKYIGGKNK